MNQVFAFIVDNFFLIFALVFVWTVAKFGWMVWKRKERGIAQPKAGDADVVFVERFASGSSHRSLMTRMGGASNCLTVVVTHSNLAINPCFPFSVFAGTFDLEHLIPLENLSTPRMRDRIIELEFTGTDGPVGKLSLVLRDPSGFLRAIGKQASDGGTETPM